MKNLTNFIQEKYLIDNDIETYSYQPKDKYELRKILEERLAKDKDADLNDIDVSKITDMGYEGFPDEKGLFEGLDPHNIKIDKWKISKVTDMCCIFYECKNFTGKGIEKWNVSNVTNMRCAFLGCSNFNCDLRKWAVNKVTDMSSMFYECKNFTGKGIEKWNVLNVKNTREMFVGCDSFENKPIWYNG